MDRKVRMMSESATDLKRAWMQLLYFMLICGVGAALSSTSAYLDFGVTVWILMGLGWRWSSPRIGNSS